MIACCLRLFGPSPASGWQSRGCDSLSGTVFLRRRSQGLARSLRQSGWDGGEIRQVRGMLLRRAASEESRSREHGRASGSGQRRIIRGKGKRRWKFTTILAGETLRRLLKYTQLPADYKIMKLLKSVTLEPEGNRADSLQSPRFQGPVRKTGSNPLKSLHQLRNVCYIRSMPLIVAYAAIRKRPMRILVMMIVLALTSAVSSHAQSDDRSVRLAQRPGLAERRLALVIGNGSYRDAPLQNPVKDADAMALALREAGFEVILRKNADRRVLFSAIKEFGQRLKRSDVGLFYYAGHGVQIESSNFLIPVDLDGSNLQDSEDLRHDAIALGELMERMRDAGTNNIIVLDACRDNPFLSQMSRSTSRGLAKVVTPASTSVLYATDPGNTASDGRSGNNGVFTKRLVEAIQRPGLELVDVMREVSVAVSRDTDGTQHPVFDGVLSSKFYFRPAAPLPSPPEAASAVTAPKAIEIQYWESADRENTPPAYRSYFRKYPDGDFADLAREKLQRLEDAKAAQQRDLQAEAEKSAREAAERAKFTKEKLEQERRLIDVENKVLLAEKRARQAEEEAAGARKAQEDAGKKRLALLVKPQPPLGTAPAGSPGGEVPRYLVATDLTVSDTRTGLVWTKNAKLSGHRLTNYQASQQAEAMNQARFAGFDDWRLPSRLQLKTLYASAKAEATGNSVLEVLKSYFSNLQELYLTGENSYKNHLAAISFDFKDASACAKSLTSSDYVVLVRGTLKDGIDDGPVAITNMTPGLDPNNF